MKHLKNFKSFAFVFNLALVLSGWNLEVCNAAFKNSEGGSTKIYFISGLEKPVFDPQKREIINKKNFTTSLSLAGALGEYLSFQVVIENHETCLPLKANLPWLKLYQLVPYRVSQSSAKGGIPGIYWDAAVEAESIPSELCPVKWGGGFKESLPSVYLFEWQIREKKVSSQFTLEVDKLKIQIPIQVFPLQFDEKVSLPFYSELTPWFLLLGHFGEWNSNEDALASAYVREMIRHRVFPLKAWVSRQQPKKNTLYGDLLQSVNQNGAFVDFQTFDSTKSKELNKIHFNEIEKLARRKNIQSMVYLWDEPQAKQLPEVVNWAKEIKKTAPHLNLMVTYPWSKELSTVIDIFVPVLNHVDASGFPDKTGYEAVQKRGGQFWSYVSCMSHGCTGELDPGEPDFVIDRGAAWIRVLGVLSGQLGLDAFLYYSSANFYQYRDKSVWETQWDFTGHGDGQLFYPGGSIGLKRGKMSLKSLNGLFDRTSVRKNKKDDAYPIASIRLKLMREASQDHQYWRWLGQFIAKNPKHLNALKIQKDLKEWVQSPRKWVREYKAYENLKNRIGALYLEQK